MSLNVSPLYHQDNIKEDPTVSQSQQAPEQGLGVLAASIGVVDAVGVGGLCWQLAQLGKLLLLRHPDSHGSLTTAVSCKTREQGMGGWEAGMVAQAKGTALWHPLR